MQRILSQWVQARGVVRLGYARYWFAEHHNMANIATSGSVVRPAPIH